MLETDCISDNREIDKTAIELFVAGVRGWEAGVRRRVDDGSPYAS